MADQKIPPRPGQSDTEPGINFTVDADTTGIGVPSITRLLDRKKLFNSKALPSTPPSSIPKPESQSEPAIEKQSEPPQLGLTSPPLADFGGHEPDLGALMPEPAIEIAATHESISSSPPMDLARPPVAPPAQGKFLPLANPELEPSYEIPDSEAPHLHTNEPQTAKRGNIVPGTEVRQSTPRLDHANTHAQIKWVAAALKNEKHPLAEIFGKVFGKTADSALIFVTDPTTQMMQVTIVVDAGFRENLWSEVRWNPDWLPDLWKNLQRGGLVELAPPPDGKILNPAGSRNVIRFALGLGSTEWLTLASIGAPEQSQGVVALISSSSLLAQLEGIRPQLKSVQLSA